MRGKLFGGAVIGGVTLAILLSVVFVNRTSPLQTETIAYETATNSGDGFLPVGQPKCTDWSALDVLVDKNNSIPRNYVPEGLTALTSASFTAGPGLTLVKEAAEELTLLEQELKNKGLSFTINSAYRSFADQEKIYSKELSAVEKSKLGLAAVPGQSEHQLGTAVDIGTVDGSPMYSSSLWNYLDQDAHRFGFVMSYRFNQQQQTGYVFEPWHWRYVGVSLATKIRYSADLPQSHYRRADCP